jgi:prolyl 4-hydroxylase
MTDPALGPLERAAAGGDVAAATRLGEILLGGGDGGVVDAPRGVGLIIDAAERGDARACALAAVIAAAGIGRPPNWGECLDQLARAAALGSLAAQQELRLLAGSGPHAADWRALRAAVDVAAWLAPPGKQTLRGDPRIRLLENFATPAVCDWLIERARPRLARAQVYHVGGGDAVVHHSRSNSETDFNIVESDVVLLLLRARIAAATGLPPAVMELTKVLHYLPGQEFHPHYDFIDPAVPGYAGELAARGQRLATFLLYLNDDYTGGETDFPQLGLRHKGARGSALLFANVDRTNMPDRRTLHAGLPPASGEKWLLSQWIRDRTPRHDISRRT